MGVQPITVPQKLATAMTSAGDKSDVDFDYLVNTAIRESSLDPKAKAGTSSATGLFQFLDSTWLRVMKQEGPRLGYQKYADAITQTSDGDYVIKDKKLRAEVLKLREDPQAAADLAAAYTRSNGEYLKGKFGRMPSPGELYIAHFLGAQGAEKFFNAGLADPDQSAAAAFPRQAKANPTIFYDHGQARTVREVYKLLVGKHDQPAPGVDANFAAQQMAAGTEVPLVADDRPAQVLALMPAAAGSQDRWPEGEIPSRFGPAAADMSFTALYANETAIPGRTLITVPGEQPGGPLFLKLYGQGPAAALTPPPVPDVARAALGALPLDLVAPEPAAGDPLDPLAPLPEPLPLTAP